MVVYGWFSLPYPLGPNQLLKEALEILPHPEQEGSLQARASGELQIKRLDYGVG